MKRRLSLPRLILRLLEEHLLMLLLGFLLFATNDFIETNRLITALATVFVGLISLTLCYNDTCGCAKQDELAGEHRPCKGLLAGLLASVPGVILYVLLLIFPATKPLYRLYMMSFQGLLSFFGDTTLANGLILLLLPIVAAWGYFDGRRGKNFLFWMRDKLHLSMYEKK